MRWLLVWSVLVSLATGLFWTERVEPRAPRQELAPQSVERLLRIERRVVRPAKPLTGTLRHAQWNEVRFVRPSFQTVEIQHGDLRGAQFEGGFLNHLTLESTDLRGASFKSVRIRDLALSSTRLTSVFISDSELMDCTFLDSDLSEAVLINVRRVRCD